MIFPRLIGFGRGNFLRNNYMKNQFSIQDLESALEQGIDIEILPDGTVKKKRGRRQSLKPLTMRKNLGSEYGLYIIGC